MIELRRLSGLACLLLALLTPAAHAIMAGGEFDLPADAPSKRLDPLGADSAFNAVGAIAMTVGSQNYKGSAVALSPNWALTAGHNVDFNDDGTPDAGLTVTFHLPGFENYIATSAITHPNFTGFGNPTVHYDLALLYFETPLPSDLSYPALGVFMSLNDTVTLAGFGRSGYGSYGYTTSASLTDRRIGYNTIRSLHPESGGDGLLFRYDFDAPATTGQPDGSLGNHLETIIGPGDSGGPVLVTYGSGHALIGINTFTEGYGGRFGDIGGGVSLEPYWTWIADTTGLPLIPEPSSVLLLGLGLLLVRSVRKRRSTLEQPPAETEGRVRGLAAPG